MFDKYFISTKVTDLKVITNKEVVDIDIKDNYLINDATETHFKFATDNQYDYSGEEWMWRDFFKNLLLTFKNLCVDCSCRIFKDNHLSNFTFNKNDYGWKLIFNIECTFITYLKNGEKNSVNKFKRLIVMRVGELRPLSYYFLEDWRMFAEAVDKLVEGGNNEKYTFIHAWDNGGMCTQPATISPYDTQMNSSFEFDEELRKHYWSGTGHYDPNVIYFE